MAVQKSKVSKSKRGMRQGSNGAKRAALPNVAVNSNGEFHLSHHISKEDGHYNGKKVVADKPVKEKAEAAEG